MHRIILNFLLIFIIMSCDTTSNVEPRFEKYFIKYYGDEGNQVGVDVEVLEDGYIILGNSTSSTGNSKILLTKVDLLGNQLWSEEFGGTAGDVAVDLAVDVDGNFIVAATVNTVETTSDVMILKVDGSGKEIQSQIYGNPGKSDIAKSILITMEGDYILTGTTTNVDLFKPGFNPLTDLEDIYSVRTSSDLIQFEPADWRSIYGFSGIDRGVEIKQKKDGSFLFFGTTNKPPSANSQQGGFNMFLFPTGPDGIAISTSPLQLFGTLSNEMASKLIETQEDGFALLGTSIKSGFQQPYLGRVRDNGDYVNSGIVPASGSVIGTSIAPLARGGFILLGETLKNDNTNIHLSKMGLNGSIIWEREFGGLDDDMAGSVQELEDGSLILVGTITLESQSKICLIKVTPEGEINP